MIKSSKAIVSNRCEVTFDFTPQDIKYSRSNYTVTTTFLLAGKE